MTFHDCRVLLRVLGDDLLTIAPAEEVGGPIRVRARLYDGDKLSLEIEDNAIAIGSETWDVEIVGDLLQRGSLRVLADRGSSQHGDTRYGELW